MSDVDEDPSDLACPVWGCRLPGYRWVVLHEYWRLAVCVDHADDVEEASEEWRLVQARGGVLRIARTDAPAPDTWRDPEPKEAT